MVLSSKQRQLPSRKQAKIRTPFSNAGLLSCTQQQRKIIFHTELTDNFTRIFTPSYVDEADSADDLDKYSAPSLVCLVESHENDAAEVNIGMIAITPSTGDVIWDDFHGMYNRACLHKVTDDSIQILLCALSLRYV